MITPSENLWILLEHEQTPQPQRWQCLGKVCATSEIGARSQLHALNAGNVVAFRPLDLLVRR